MVKRSRGNRAARVSFLGLLVVLAVAAAFSRELAVEYYRLKLGWSREFVREALGEPAGSIERIALAKFARTTQGVSAVLDAYLAMVEEGLGRGLELPQVERGMLWMGGRDSMWAYLDRPFHGELVLLQIDSIPSLSPSGLHAMHRLLAGGPERDLLCSRYPRLRFRFVPEHRACELLGPSLPLAVAEQFLVGPDPVCLLTRTTQPTVAELVQELEHGEPDLRQEAAMDLLELGAGAVEAVPALIGALRNPDLRVSYVAAEALGRLAAGFPAARLALNEALRDRDQRVRDAAGYALSLSGIE